ncbi:hypothetical protein LMG9964_03289 [Paraburkholderia phenoliruptrix]|uniref:Uncharacterized protein n=1 Tax=Paraburkholderia phenoliruptrix TaxID=252970 RepID=A0A6J5K6G1_9BURK|nr:hypothetical protein LMG9964_03289 [Paraburkholderia phenoliruptrix]
MAAQTASIRRHKAIRRTIAIDLAGDRNRKFVHILARQSIALRSRKFGLTRNEIDPVLARSAGTGFGQFGTRSPHCADRCSLCERERSEWKLLLLAVRFRFVRHGLKDRTSDTICQHAVSQGCARIRVDRPRANCVDRICPVLEDCHLILPHAWCSRRVGLHLSGDDAKACMVALRCTQSLPSSLVLARGSIKCSEAAPRRARLCTFTFLFVHVIIVHERRYPSFPAR